MLAEPSRLHTALDEVQERADALTNEIAWQSEVLEHHLAQVRNRRAAIARLEARRDEHQALIAEVHDARAQRLHATYVAREPVVILSSGAGE